MIDGPVGSVEQTQTTQDKAHAASSRDLVKDTIPPPLPRLFKIDDKVKIDWIEAEPDERFKALKKKLANNVHHVPFAEFKDSVDLTTEQVNRLLQEDEKYAVLWDYKAHSSRRWVYELAKDTLKKQPDATTYTNGKAEIQYDFPVLKSLSEQGINTFVIYDDAIYSGEQVNNRLLAPIFSFYEKYKPNDRPRIILATPYITRRYLKQIDRFIKAGLIEIANVGIMPELSDLITEDDKTLLTERNDQLDPPTEPVKPAHPLEVSYETDVLTPATLTFFDHRVGDSH